MLDLRSGSARLIFAIVIAVFLLFLLFPIAWMVSTSLKPEGEIFQRVPALIPHAPTLANYRNAISKTHIMRYLANSLITAGGSALLTTSLAAYAAYGFAKFRFYGRKPLMILLISAQMFPFPVILLTLYPLLQSLGLLNSYPGLIMGYIVFALPAGMYMMFTYLVRLPTELIEAGRIDGASELAILHKVVFPLSLPALVAVAVYSFMWAWNDLLYSLTLITGDAQRTIGPGLLLSFFGDMQQDWGGAMAASLMASVPSIVLFMLLQRMFIAGLTAGSVKA
ncbi:MAG: carbohydrate ABC transporter permease [Rhodospirillales bacterium]|nr:carbohydrate ABC transporter permease [Rhodospirillales bacterium]